jgi:hypothetical protein
MNKEPELMTDTELDALLAHASAPPLPLGAKQRLMAKLSHVEGAGAAHSTVVPLRRPEKVASRLGWLAGLPLAASLALGIYLGSGDNLETYLPPAAYELLAGANADEPLTGIEDVEGFSEDDIT